VVALAQLGWPSRAFPGCSSCLVLNDGAPPLMAKSKSEPIPSNFEDALTQLDSIVEDLEGDAVPLADLVNQYDRGMKLLEACQLKLDEAKQRVATIGKSANHKSASPTDLPESPAEDVNDELF